MLEAIEKYKSKSGLKDVRDMTYMEFEYAVAKYLGVDIIAFVDNKVIDMYESGSINEGLRRFYEVVREEKAFGKWSEEPASMQSITALNAHVDKRPDLPGWIREKDSTIFKSVTNAGITDIALDGFLSRGTLHEWLDGAQSLKLCYTTGMAFIHNNGDILSDFIAKGGIIQLLCCKPYSQALYDIQEVEETMFLDRKRIHHELIDVYKDLQSIYKQAKVKNEKSGINKLGEIQIGFLSTLFRSSFLIVENDLTDKKSGVVYNHFAVGKITRDGLV